MVADERLLPRPLLANPRRGSKLVVYRAPLARKERYRRGAAARRDAHARVGNWNAADTAMEKSSAEGKNATNFSPSSQSHIPSCSTHLLIFLGAGAGDGTDDGADCCGTVRGVRRRGLRTRGMRGYERERAPRLASREIENDEEEPSVSLLSFPRFQNVPAPFRVEPARPRTGRVAARAMVIEGERKENSRRKEEGRGVRK